MTRFLLFVVLGVSPALGLLRPLPLGEAASVAKTLAQGRDPNFPVNM
jgi:hypothetical protein